MVSTSLRMPKELWDELNLLASQHGYGRTELMIHFLRWAMREFRATHKKPKP